MIRLTSVLTWFLLSMITASSAQEVPRSTEGQDRPQLPAFLGLRETDGSRSAAETLRQDGRVLRPAVQTPLALTNATRQSQVTAYPPTGITMHGNYILDTATYEIGQQPSGLVIADFNGDGIADIATTSWSDKTISILLGKPDGTMAQPRVIPLTTGVSAIAAGDFNRDGKEDLALIDSNGNYVWIMVGIGDGTFQPPVPYATSYDPIAITVGDVNGDGKLDLIVANNCSPLISVLLGNGDGTFATHVDYDAAQGGGCGFLPSAAAIGDVNGDGKPDLVIAVSTYVSVLLGNGDGTFQAFTEYGNGGLTTSVAIADFNGDHKLDLAVTRGYSAVVSILLGAGDGTFPTETDYPTANGPIAVLIADFNGDGKFDVATTNEPWGVWPPPFGSVSVLLGNGDGTLQPHLDYGVGATPIVAAADFNGDGRLDLAVASQNCQNYQPCGTGQLSITPGNGDGTFPQPVAISVNNISNGIAAADLNNDRKPDLLVGNWNGVSVLLGNGNGSFQPEVDYPATYGTSVVLAADFNGDHRQDVALLNSGISVLLGNGDGTLQGHVDSATAPSQTDMIAGDFNNDGKLDLVTVGGLGTTISILLGNGDGTFRNHVEYPAGSSTMRVAAGDFNGDGKLDLAVTNFNNAGTVSILLGNGDGTFQPPIAANAGQEPLSIAVGDFNGDGKLDIAVQNYYNSLGQINASVLLGNGDGTFQAPLGFPTSDVPIGLIAADVDGDGNLDLVFPTSTYVGVLYGNGDGTFRSPVDYLRTFTYGSLLAADLTGNQVTDLAIVGSNGGSAISLQLNSPQIALRPNSFTFYQQAIGNTSSPKTFVLSNPSVAPLNLSGITAVGDFNQTNTCQSILTAGASCNLTANFKPTLAGLRTGGVLIHDNAPTGMHGLFFSGLGYAITLTPGGSNFGIVTLGRATTQHVVITNRGAVAVSINSIVIVGPNRADFSQTNTCGHAIPANSNCTMTLNFRPTKAGTKLAAVSITDSDALSSRSIPLRGIARVR